MTMYRVRTYRRVPERLEQGTPLWKIWAVILLILSSVCCWGGFFLFALARLGA